MSLIYNINDDVSYLTIESADENKQNDKSVQLGAMIWCNVSEVMSWTFQLKVKQNAPIKKHWNCWENLQNYLLKK